MTKVPVVSAEKTLSSHELPVVMAIGYSARALAQALSDTGFRVITVDAFGDCDTSEISILSHRLLNWGSSGAEMSVQPHLWSNQIVAEGNQIVAEGHSPLLGEAVAEGHSPLLGEAVAEGHSPLLGEAVAERGKPEGHSPLQGKPEGHSPLLVLLGGGCENWPALQDHLAVCKGLRLLGPSPKQFRQLRDIDLWRQAANFAGIRFPETIPSELPNHLGNSRLNQLIYVPRRPFQWLLKSIFSAGGVAVRRISKVHSEREDSDESPNCHFLATTSGQTGSYIQQEISGRVLGAVCVSLGNTPTVVKYLGVTEAWKAGDWDGPTEFIYRGSWGPIQLADRLQRQVISAAEFLAAQTGVKGWLQVDLVEDDWGELWFLEVNPRWSAGMEVFHRIGTVNPVLEHLRAWESECALSPLVQSEFRTDSALYEDPNLPGHVGKAVVYCSDDVLLTKNTIERLQRLSRHEFADIPSEKYVGQVIQSGHPLVTVIASVAASLSSEEARQQLLSKLKALQIQALKNP